jgi:hypothetical protein
MPLPYRSGHRDPARLAARLRPSSSLCETGPTIFQKDRLHSASRSSGKTYRMPMLYRPEATADARHNSPRFRIPHKPSPRDRGFVLRRLSNAKRRPKLFTKPVRQLWSVQRRKADVCSQRRPTAAVDHSGHCPTSRSTARKRKKPPLPICRLNAERRYEQLPSLLGGGRHGELEDGAPG